jgi:hypothetical protein
VGEVGFLRVAAVGQELHVEHALSFEVDPIDQNRFASLIGEDHLRWHAAIVRTETSFAFAEWRDGKAGAWHDEGGAQQHSSKSIHDDPRALNLLLLSFGEKGPVTRSICEG